MLRLEKYNNNNFAEYYSLVKEDEVMKYITGKGMSVSEAKDKFQSIIKINKEESAFGYFRVLDTDSNILGECKMVHYKRDSSLLEVGYLLKKTYWGKGLGTKICERMIALSFSVAPKSSIVGIIHPDNYGSKKILENFGFESYFNGTEDNIPTEKLILRR